MTFLIKVALLFLRFYLPKYFYAAIRIEPIIIHQ